MDNEYALKIKSKPRKSLQDRKKIYAILFILPAFIFIFSFMIYPIVYTLFMSFQEFNFVYDDAAKFIGLDNYVKAFNDTNFLVAMKNTFTYGIIYFILIMIVSLSFALILFNTRRFSGLFKTVIFIPIVVPVSLSALVFMWILQPNYGLLNHFLGDILGLTQLTYPWLNHGTTAMAAIIVVSLWATIGFETILFLGGLQSISGEVLEAAEMDGASGWRKIVFIILPNLRETYIITGIWAIIHALKVFVEPMVMTNGGPGNSTLVMYQEIYYTAFVNFDMGYAAAMAYILGIFTLVLSITNFYINRTKDE
ncbi:MAG: sugar ABC transporter permease [Paenibacillaceae bacterium]